jgi:hypothetical protein
MVNDQPVDDRPEIDETELRRRVEKRVQERSDALRELFSNIAIFLIVNLLLFNVGGWLMAVLRGENASTPGLLWITALWGLWLVSEIWDYFNRYGPGRRWRERWIERELQREMLEMQALRHQIKRKNSDLLMDSDPLTEPDAPPDPIVYRMGDDGELIPDDADQQQRRSIMPGGEAL